MTWEERGTIIYLYNGILNGIQVRLLPETLKREAGVNPAQCRCCIGGAVLIGHWGYALGRREPRWMPESEYLPVYDAQEASPVQGRVQLLMIETGIIRFVCCTRGGTVFLFCGSRDHLSL